MKHLFNDARMGEFCQLGYQPVEPEARQEINMFSNTCLFGCSLDLPGTISGLILQGHTN